jgi:hypothetical protein
MNELGLDEQNHRNKKTSKQIPKSSNKRDAFDCDISALNNPFE